MIEINEIEINGIDIVKLSIEKIEINGIDIVQLSIENEKKCNIGAMVELA